MKTSFSLVCSLLLFSQFAFAQSEFNPQTSVGIKGGTSFSTYTFTPARSQNVTMGYTGGLVLKHISQPNLGVQLELNYVQRGWTEKFASTQTYRRSLDFIEVPFMTHVVIGKKNTALMANFGPSLAFLVSNSDSLQSVNDMEEIGYYQKEIENPIQFGLALGFGVLQKTSLGVFQLEGRLTQSLSNVITTKQGLSSAKNTNLTVSVSYLINLGPATKPKG